MTLKRLSPEVARLIAAGEVVERPLSVVKELIENSLDAGASRIDVKIVAGGKTLISVADNGCGIAPADLPLAVEKHVTSKIATVEDLGALRSLGYRGEALASLCAVAEVEIYSRVQGGDGAWLTASQEVLSSPRPSGHGTTVVVKDLFYNLPARRKFLSSPQGEARRIAELVRDYSICWPDVAFSLEHEGRQMMATSGKGGREGALSARWGTEPKARCRSGSEPCGQAEVWWQDGGVGSRFSLITFINGRRVNDKALRAAIMAHPWAGRGNWFLNLTLPPEDLDVNIHPAKTEVLLRRSGEVFALVRAVAGLFATDHATLPPRALTVTSEAWRGKESPKPNPFSPLTSPFASRGGEPKRKAPALAEDLPFGPNFGRQKPLTVAEPRPLVVDEGDAPRGESRTLFEEGSDPTYLGQMPEGYLLFADGDGLVVMDPHAAHERVNYQKFVQSFREQKPLVQPLASPLQLPPSLQEGVEGQEEKLAPLGFEFDKGALVACPQVPFDLSPLRLLRGALAALEEGENRDLLDRFATRACKASVKLTTQLAPSEALALYRATAELEKSCPHGRPITLRLTAKALDDYFGRNGL